MGWDDPVGPEGFLIHKHWCNACFGYWQHDDTDCGKPAGDGVLSDWPCPEHEDKEKKCD